MNKVFDACWYVLCLCLCMFQNMLQCCELCPVDEGDSATPSPPFLHRSSKQTQHYCKISLLSDASVSGGALELEDLAGVMGAVGLLATLGDEFVAGCSGCRCDDVHDANAGAASASASTTATTTATTQVGARTNMEGGGTGGHAACVCESAGGALRECLSEKARQFFEGANKVGVCVCNPQETRVRPLFLELGAAWFRVVSFSMLLCRFFLELFPEIFVVCSLPEIQFQLLYFREIPISLRFRRCGCSRNAVFLKKIPG